ncbi:MAG TPA: histone deacetylase family protein, partial [Methyloceanibacter sp.]|nr:histone deacetylase family protein [Methyloceanibacter sp.]
MLRIRKVADATTAVNRSAIEAAQSIMREQFPLMPDYDIAKLPEQLANPLKHRFVSRLFVAENARDQTLGLALLLHAPDIGFSYLELISTALGRTGRGIGATLYERVREEARALGTQIYFESLPDDPALSTNPEIRANNANRLKFYERYGARPIVNTAYETPVTPGTTDPPYLLLDPLGANDLPSRDKVRKVVRAILERKYGSPADYVQMVVDSIKDDPIKLREPRYTRRIAAQKGVVRESSDPGIPLVLNDDHTIHHVQERGYVEAPVRIRSIMAELDASGLFQKVPAKRYSDRHIRAVHDGRLVDYIRKACLMAGPKKSIYPYVFPTRNPARAPKDETVLAGYYCIDTFTPLNQNAYLAARSAVDCALTAAERVLEGANLAYALVRPPGHHAETRTFGGFCYFNNGAVATNLLSRYGRVAILDIDYHHGNGQQEIFYNRADVLTVSIHGHPSFAYPYFSGFRDETGTGPGAGYNLNIPLPEHITTEQHRNAVAEGLRRIRRFAPAFLVVCAGFDTARGDPTGTWPNRARDFDQLGRMIGEQGYSTLVVQEGGYRVRTLGANVRSFFNGLATGRSSARQVAPALARSAAART